MSRSSQWCVLGVALLAVVAGGACSSGGGRAPRTPAQEAQEAQPAQPVQPVQPSAPSPAPPPAAEPPSESAPEEVAGAYGPQTVVIDDPEPEVEETQTLAETARMAREARAKEGAPIAVITDETLSDYATGELSIAKEKSKTATADGESGDPAATPEAEAEAEERGEEYWRERVRGARMRWRDLVEEITRLEGQVGELRQRFYAEDDGFYRDSQIKPAWDRALDRLAETRDEVRRAQENLTTILQEGRLEGALPGWLREGIEYEPAADDEDDGPGIHEATEPKVLEEDGEIDNGR